MLKAIADGVVATKEDIEQLMANCARKFHIFSKPLIKKRETAEVGV